LDGVIFAALWGSSWADFLAEAMANRITAGDGTGYKAKKRVRM
jgi:hypothetical protein